MLIIFFTLGALVRYNLALLPILSFLKRKSEGITYPITHPYNILINSNKHTLSYATDLFPMYLDKWDISLKIKFKLIGLLINK